MQFNEERFKEYVKPHIQRCRSGDWNHALRVVRWVKELGEDRDDLHLLTAAACIHDIGWRDVLPSDERITFEQLIENEEKANENSTSFAAEVLQDFGFATEDIATILRFINAADAHKSSADDEAIIVDADNLSKLDINHLKEKYQKSDWQNTYQVFERMVSERIQTSRGKELYPNLLRELKMAMETALGQ